MDQENITQVPNVPKKRIKWNEVTWYSKLLSVIFFLGVVPVLAFCFGMQYQDLKHSAELPISVSVYRSNISAEAGIIATTTPSRYKTYATDEKHPDWKGTGITSGGKSGTGDVRLVVFSPPECTAGWGQRYFDLWCSGATIEIDEQSISRDIDIEKYDPKYPISPFNGFTEEMEVESKTQEGFFDNPTIILKGKKTGQGIIYIQLLRNTSGREALEIRYRWSTPEGNDLVKEIMSTLQVTPLPTYDETVNG